MKHLYWFPRILSIVFLFSILFFSVKIGSVMEFFISLIPFLLITIITIISWIWESIGGLLFILMGIIFVISALVTMNIYAIILVASPMFLIGIGFWVYEIKSNY